MIICFKQAIKIVQTVLMRMKSFVPFIHVVRTNFDAAMDDVSSKHGDVIMNMIADQMIIVMRTIVNIRLVPMVNLLVPTINAFQKLNCVMV